MRRVFLVVDGDRHVLDVCESEDTAIELARQQNCTVESWPVSTSARERAWAHAFETAQTMLGNLANTEADR